MPKAFQSLKQDLINSSVVEHGTALEFRNHCLAWLAQEEIVNHSVISLSDALLRKAPIYEPPFFFSHVSSGGQISGCSIYAEPDGLILSEFAPEMMPSLFEHIEHRIDLPSRIFGPKPAALELAELFAASRNLNFRVHSTWRSHVLEEPSVLNEPASGHIRSASADDHELVRTWGRQYDREKPANLSIEKFLLNKLDEGNLLFWANSNPVCLAAMSGMNCAGPRISAVYTPSAMRGHGYASTLVHELGKKFLSSGRPYITLSTVVGDPVERIYQKLGYRPVGERISVVFA